jgi:hypothetical protein
MRHGLAPSATSRVRKVMIMRNPCLAAALEELAKAGIRHPEVITSGKHLQLRWMTATEQPRMLTVPSTPSDWRHLRTHAATYGAYCAPTACWKYRSRDHHRHDN